MQSYIITLVFTIFLSSVVRCYVYSDVDSEEGTFDDQVRCADMAYTNTQLKPGSALNYTKMVFFYF